MLWEGDNSMGYFFWEGGHTLPPKKVINLPWTYKNLHYIGEQAFMSRAVGDIIS